MFTKEEDALDKKLALNVDCLRRAFYVGFGLSLFAHTIPLVALCMSYKSF